MKQDADRDFYMTAHEAKAYGLVDEVLEPARPLPPVLTESASEGDPANARSS